MTLLDATSLLIEIAKTRGADDRITRKAIRRMEERLNVLQFRKQTALLRRRHRAWPFRDIKDLRCPSCSFELSFGDFARDADIDYRSLTKSWHCPACRAFLMGYERPPDAVYDLTTILVETHPSHAVQAACPHPPPFITAEGGQVQYCPLCLKHMQ